jgi:hypothetical protein
MVGKEDDVQRRDSLHAIINALPDPNYATLRAVVLVSLFFEGSLQGATGFGIWFLLASSNRSISTVYKKGLQKIE